MQFSSNEIYHIFNRGNNSQRIFFNRENYLFFLKKIKTYISSYADILAWCLMPNHFHLMVYINRVETEVNEIEEMSEQVTGSRQLTGSHQLTKGEHSEQVTESRQLPPGSPGKGRLTNRFQFCSAHTHGQFKGSKTLQEACFNTAQKQFACQMFQVFLRHGFKPIMEH